MRTTNMLTWLKFSMAFVAVVSVASLLTANDDEKAAKVDRAEQKRLSRVWKTQTPVQGFDSVEMFAGMKSGQIEVIVKTKDEANLNVMVKNKTDKPLAIEMPPAFAAVPVMAQGLGGGGMGMGGMGGMGGGMGGMGGGGMGGMGGMGGQGIGGGMGGGMGGGGMGGMGGGGMGGMGGGMGGMGGGGVFNIPPGRVGKLAIKTFCLEHGKPNPRPAMKYTIAPIETLSTDPKVAEMCRMLANDEITQQVAQAAAWNTANGLSWQELLVKNRVELMGGYFERYFTPQQLMMAQQVVRIAGLRAEERAKYMKDLEMKNYTKSGEYSESK